MGGDRSARARGAVEVRRHEPRPRRVLPHRLQQPRAVAAEPHARQRRAHGEADLHPDARADGALRRDLPRRRARHARRPQEARRPAHLGRAGQQLALHLHRAEADAQGVGRIIYASASSARTTTRRSATAGAPSSKSWPASRAARRSSLDGRGDERTFERIAIELRTQSIGYRPSAFPTTASGTRSRSRCSPRAASRASWRGREGYFASATRSRGVFGNDARRGIFKRRRAATGRRPVGIIRSLPRPRGALAHGGEQAGQVERPEPASQGRATRGEFLREEDETK